MLKAFEAEYIISHPSERDVEGLKISNTEGRTVYVLDEEDLAKGPVLKFVEESLERKLQEGDKISSLKVYPVEAFYRVGKASNVYGGVVIKISPNNKFLWCVEGESLDKWEEIPESLFLELLKFNSDLISSQKLRDSYEVNTERNK